jgi:hypothetical protein
MTTQILTMPGAAVGRAGGAQCASQFGVVEFGCRRRARTAHGALRVPSRNRGHGIVQLWPSVQLFAGAGAGRRQYGHIAGAGEAVHMRAALMSAAADAVVGDESMAGGDLLSPHHP